MKISNTSARLQEVMKSRGLKQVDVLALAKPFCDKYGVRLGRNDLSQYVNGKVEPGSDKLTILGLSLNLSEAWLMGYDVPPERKQAEETETPATSPLIQEITGILADLNEQQLAKVASYIRFIKSGG